MNPKLAKFGTYRLLMDLTNLNVNELFQYNYVESLNWLKYWNQYSKENK